MKVKELIELLQKENPESIVTAGQDGGWIRNMTISKHQLRKNDDPLEVIVFTPNGSEPNPDEYTDDQDSYEEAVRQYASDIPSTWQNPSIKIITSVEWYDDEKDNIKSEHQYQSYLVAVAEREKEIEAQKKYDEQQRKVSTWGGITWFQKFDDGEE